MLSVQDLISATYLHVAVWYAATSPNADQDQKYYEIVKVLIENNANIHAQDTQNNTPLHWALLLKNIDMALHLAQNYRPNVTLKNNQGKTAYELAEALLDEISKNERSASMEVGASDSESGSEVSWGRELAACQVPSVQPFGSCQVQNLEQKKIKKAQQLFQELKSLKEQQELQSKPVAPGALSLALEFQKLSQTLKGHVLSGAQQASGASNSDMRCLTNPKCSPKKK